MHRFKELEIWKQSRVFCTDIYSITSSFPDSERLRLSNQMRRASVSIPSNIAEGSSRSSDKDFASFLEIAIGSAYEVETQLLISFDLGFLNDQQKEILVFKLEAIIKMISRFRSLLIKSQLSNSSQVI
ncbi:MAG: four helix bundle protein [Flavobacterium sp.]|nr:MAG: four helix bundle protein [Flavobacterium sp.]